MAAIPRSAEVLPGGCAGPQTEYSAHLFSIMTMCAPHADMSAPSERGMEGAGPLGYERQVWSLCPSWSLRVAPSASPQLSPTGTQRGPLPGPSVQAATFHWPCSPLLCTAENRGCAGNRHLKLCSWGWGGKSRDSSKGSGDQGGREKQAWLPAGPVQGAVLGPPPHNTPTEASRVLVPGPDCFPGRRKVSQRHGEGRVAHTSVGLGLCGAGHYHMKGGGLSGLGGAQAVTWIPKAAGDGGGGRGSTLGWRV